jgi:hypothetical protein
MSEERKERHAEDLSAGDATGASPPDVRRAADEDLPPELKAIEAALASLTPRTDRLDRERLIFLAGRQSACRSTKGTVPFSLRENRDSPLRENRDSPLRENRDSPRVRWGWPAAFSAMTAVAASLLVALLLQGQPRVEVRIVKVPVEPAGNGQVVPGENLPVPPAAAPRIGPLPDKPEAFPKPVAGSGLFALVGLDWAQLYDRERPGSETSYPSLRERLLREGVDSWPAPSPGANVKPTPAPLPYRKFLEKVLGTPASDEPVPDWPLIQSLFHSGANS